MVHLGILQPYIHYSVLQKLLLPLPLRSLQFQEYALITNRIRSPHVAIMKNIRSHKMSEHWRASRTILITDTAYTSITLIRIQLLLNTYSEALLTIHKPIFTRSLKNPDERNPLSGQFNDWSKPELFGNCYLQNCRSNWGKGKNTLRFSRVFKHRKLQICSICKLPSKTSKPA